tara:strand:- start:3801 stop:4289 length:489 start_codon:yes stop_codon:yes gene_type:complete
MKWKTMSNLTKLITKQIKTMRDNYFSNGQAPQGFELFSNYKVSRRSNLPLMSVSKSQVYFNQAFYEKHQLTDSTTILYATDGKMTYMAFRKLNGFKENTGYKLTKISKGNGRSHSSNTLIKDGLLKIERYQLTYSHTIYDLDWFACVPHHNITHDEINEMAR